MMKKQFNWLAGAISLVLTFASTTAFATLDIELTQGISDAVPVAVIPFADTQKNQTAEADVAQIIHQDLNNSGRFSLLPTKKIKKKPSQASDVSIKYWRKQQVDYVIVGEVTKQDADKLRIKATLVEMYPDATEIDGQKKHVVLTREFVVAPAGLRRAAHRMSDEIYEHLTGEQGIFSTRIAYVLMKHRHNKPYQYELQVADYDGHNAYALLTSPEPIMSPSWSPDGKRLSYVSFEGERSEVYIQSIETGARQKVAHFTGINSAPSWSPDGRKMAVVLSHTGKPKIHVMDIASGQFRQITRGLSIDTEPSWAPDGQSLFFTSNRGGGPQIYRVSLATLKVERITYDGRYNASADVAQNGENIAYLHIEGSKFTIAAHNMDTGMMTVLTKASSGLDESPSMSPNGRMIIYATQQGNQGILSMVSVDGRIHLRLPAHDGNVQEPAWSPYIA